MLRATRRSTIRSAGGSFAIVASRYNAKYVDAMLRAAVAELNGAGAKEIQVVRVPGAFEIPAVAATLDATVKKTSGPAANTWQKTAPKVCWICAASPGHCPDRSSWSETMRLAK